MFWLSLPGDALVEFAVRRRRGLRIGFPLGLSATAAADLQETASRLQGIVQRFRISA